MYGAVLVLSWNLKHGRSVPGAGRELFDEFAAALASWAWDAALLQEVPPWWPALLASRLGADARFVLTSRNVALPLRRAVAVRWPDAIKSNGGGCNAILVRGGGVADHRTARLCWLPERRWVHGVRVAERWLANLHTTSDAGQGKRAAGIALGWAAGQPLVLGGDFNVRSLILDGLRHAGGHGVDHVYARGLEGGPTTVLDAGRLSDHRPVLVELSPSSAD